MAASRETTEGTAVPQGHAGLPQMNVGTFPSQIFWLVVTFGLLFLVLWRKTLPMIEGAIGQRRGRAHQLADENRKITVAEIERLKAAADAEAQNAFGIAEKRISAERGKALVGVRTAAAEAAAQIVERLIGVAVSTEDAAKAVPAIEAKGG